MKIFCQIAMYLSILALLGCGSVDRVVRVVDADTGAPVMGAFVYARDYNPFDPFSLSGLYKSDANGEVSIGESYTNLVASAGKEGYGYNRDCTSAEQVGDKLVTVVKLSKEQSGGAQEARVELFRPFASDSTTAEIASQMRRYFSVRNTIMATAGEPCIVEARIRVLDAETHEPISDAMAYVRSGYYSGERYECMEVSDENGYVRASVNLMSPNINIDTGKEGYAPTKRFSKDPYKHGYYTVWLSKKGSATSIVLGDTSDFSRRKTNNRLWERFKSYYISKGGVFKYLREVY